MALVFIDGQYSHIQCDGHKCGERSPPWSELDKAGGLGSPKIGWFVAGGIHRCPKHFTEETTPRGPIYLVHQGKKLVPDPKKLQP